MKSSSKMKKNDDASGDSRKWRRFILPACLLAIVAAAWICSRFWLQLMLIQGPSMEPAYHSFQPVLLDRSADTFRKAVDAYQAKNYQEAIRLYNEAVEKPYKEGSPFTDAQIYSNLGMAFSSIKEYKKAYKYLTVAWNMGCQNPSVSRELAWLRKNAAGLIF